MSSLLNFAHRTYLRLGGGKSRWHQRFYRPSVNIVRSDSKIWFEEGSVVLEAQPLHALKGVFKGRANLLLSGPSVKGLSRPVVLAESDLICVNGSPSIYDASIPDMRIYHVNDATFIRNDIDRFIRFSKKAEFTIIDYRAVYELLRLAPERLHDETKWIIYDSWGYPLNNALGDIPRLAKVPEYQGIYISNDLRLGLAVGGTVAYTGAQVAWHGGYDSLYMYGLDLTNSGRSYSETSAQPQMLDKSYERVIVPAFELFVREAMATGFQVYNCNPNSRLPSSILPHLGLNESLTHLLEQN